jgi:hypothetical protein
MPPARSHRGATDYAHKPSAPPSASGRHRPPSPSHDPHPRAPRPSDRRPAATARPTPSSPKAARLIPSRPTLLHREGKCQTPAHYPFALGMPQAAPTARPTPNCISHRFTPSASRQSPSAATAGRSASTSTTTVRPKARALRRAAVTVQQRGGVSPAAFPLRNPPNSAPTSRLGRPRTARSPRDTFSAARQPPKSRPACRLPAPPHHRHGPSP